VSISCITVRLLRKHKSEHEQQKNNRIWRWSLLDEVAYSERESYEMFSQSPEYSQAQNILRYSTGKHFFLTLSSNKFSCDHDAFTDHGSGCLISRKRRLNESFSIPGYKFGKTSNRQEGFSTDTLLLLQIMCRKYLLALSRILITSFARII
jgi:hypothetical protein